MSDEFAKELGSFTRYVTERLLEVIAMQHGKGKHIKSEQVHFVLIVEATDEKNNEAGTYQVLASNMPDQEDIKVAIDEAIKRYKSIEYSKTPTHYTPRGSIQ